MQLLLHGHYLSGRGWRGRYGYNQFFLLFLVPQIVFVVDTAVVVVDMPYRLVILTGGVWRLGGSGRRSSRGNGHRVLLMMVVILVF